MLSFSANLGFLWQDRALPDAIRAAKSCGFSAVECHWPYQTPAKDVKAALDETGLPMLGLNTSRGDLSAGENGIAAVPGRQLAAKAAIDEAIAYAVAIDCKSVHVMCGFADGEEAHAVFVENLRYATGQAIEHNITILIEPLNRNDAPGYFLKTTDQARDLIDEVGAPNLQLMFDCYHVGRIEGDVVTRMKDLMPIIGHIQFASVPERGPPDQGELNYAVVFDAISASRYEKALGAEYKPIGKTEDTLGWMKQFS